MIKKYVIPALVVLGVILIALYQYQKYRVAPKTNLANIDCIDSWETR